jgi:ubiquinone/menaquinone biosynthesis C-methylase UbiE
LESLNRIIRRPANALMETSATTRFIRRYDRAAWFYEGSAAVFSLGQIRAAKRYAVEQLRSGGRVVFLGVGTGEDAIMAAENGCQVTCVDISRGMLDRLEARLAKRNLSAEIVCQNAFDYHPAELFDACTTNFFLNTFREADMVQMLVHAATLVRPGGKFLITDVAIAQGNFLSKAANVVYLKSAMIAYWLLGMIPLHRNYDYAAYFAQAGLAYDHHKTYKLFPAGPIVYQVTVGSRSREPSET